MISLIEIRRPLEGRRAYVLGLVVADPESCCFRGLRNDFLGVYCDLTHRNVMERFGGRLDHQLRRFYPAPEKIRHYPRDSFA